MRCAPRQLPILVLVLAIATACSEPASETSPTLDTAEYVDTATTSDASAANPDSSAGVQDVTPTDAGQVTDIHSSVDTAPQDTAPPSYPLDDVLRVNHIQAKGTHNSYHLKVGPNTIPQWDYEFDALDVQLAQQGVRQLELDVHYTPAKKGEGKATWEVLHVPFVDPKSSCPTLNACLSLAKKWSDANPGHHLLFILIEPKDALDTNKITGHYDELDAAILAVWPKERLLRPDDVRGKHPTLRDALLKEGWPTLGQTRDKAMFVMLDEGHHRDGYLQGHEQLQDRVIFMRGGKGKPWGAVLEHGNPIGDQAKIQDAVKAGYLVRTKADDPDKSADDNAKKAAAALSSGAQLISSDFPKKTPKSPYVFKIPDGAPSRCNPLTAPKECSSKAIEALQ